MKIQDRHGKERTVLYLKPEIKKKAKIQAIEQGITLSELFETLVSKAK